MEKIEHLTHEGTPYVRTTNVQKMEIQRAGQSTKSVVEDVFLAKEDGSLQQFATKMVHSGAVTRFTGKVASDGKTLEITTQGGASQAPVKESIPWNPKYGGLYALSKLTQDPPLEPGQKRSVTAFVPVANKPAKHTIEGLGREIVTMLDGSQMSLLKTRQQVEFEGQPAVESTIWLDDKGVVIKQMSLADNFEIYRCSKEFAQSPNKKVSFDLALDTIVPVEGMPEKLDTYNELTYQLKLKTGDPAKIFASSSNQRVTDIDAHSAKLQVWRIGPDSALPAQLPKSGKPTAADLAASPLIQVDDPAVQRLIRQAAISGSDPGKQAIELERFVHETIDEKNFSQGFLSAAEVAQGKTGDCTEHAVLLMALLRAQGIPSRGALGLVYVDYGEKKGFAYHMWTEAWVGDRWLPLDATRGKGGIGVEYIKVTQTELSGSGAFAAFLPVTQVIGQLEIDVAK